MDSSSVASAASQIRTLEALQTETTSNQLGKDEFLQILVAQLSNQDPMDPTSDTDFIAQLAQFSMLEQMQSINSGFMTSQAYSLIGKTVYIEGDTDAEVICGKVDGVVRKDGIDYLLIGDETYDVSKVTGVLDDDATDGVTEEKILQSASLIGKTVEATFTNDNGEEVSVSGQVERITIQDNAIFVVVDGVNVPLSDIQEIAE